jgi:hypothetical protein
VVAVPFIIPTVNPINLLPEEIAVLASATERYGPYLPSNGKPAFKLILLDKFIPLILISFLYYFYYKLAF